MGAPKNLRIDIFSCWPFWGPLWPFCILQAVCRCRQWASVPSVARYWADGLWPNHRYCNVREINDLWTHFPSNHMDVLKIVVYISLHVFSIFLPPPFNWCDKIYYSVNSFTGNNLFTEETMIKLYGCYYHIQLRGRSIITSTEAVCPEKLILMQYWTSN